VLCWRWYLRHPLSYHDLEEMMAERRLKLDHSTIAPGLLSYAPSAERADSTGNSSAQWSWRVEETYVRVAGTWTYSYGTIDSAGNIIDFVLLPKADLTAAKPSLHSATSQVGSRRPRVINVDGHPAYPGAIEELKWPASLAGIVTCLNNILEQDNRFVKKRMITSQWFRSVDGALRTIEGYEATQISLRNRFAGCRRSTLGQAQFIDRTLGIAA
jgi:transposase-like protein